MSILLNPEPKPSKAEERQVTPPVDSVSSMEQSGQEELYQALEGLANPPLTPEKPKLSGQQILTQATKWAELGFNKISGAISRSRWKQNLNASFSPPPSMSELADEMLGNNGLGAELALVVQDAFWFKDYELTQESAASMIGTLFWQSFIESPIFPSYLQQLGASPRALHASRKIILSHGEQGKQRLDLLILDPGLSHEVKNSLSTLHVSSDDLSEGWKNFITPRQKTPQPNASLNHSVEMFAVWKSHMPAIAIAAPPEAFGMILLPQPKIRYTLSADPSSTSSIFLPQSAVGVATKRNGQPIASVGIYAKDRDGRFGFTTANHAIKHRSTVFIGEIPCSVDKKQHGTDACFVAPDEPNLNIPTNPIKGPMSNGMLPRQYEKGYFRGVNSGTAETMINAWDHELPFAINLPDKYHCVYTPPVTAPGDSGAALISEETSLIIGFAAYVFTNTVLESAWVWAEEVFHTLEIPW